MAGRMIFRARPGSFAVHSMVWIVFLMMLAGAAAERGSYAVALYLDAAPAVRQEALASIGASMAEDWIISAFERGEQPAASGVGGGHASAAARLGDGSTFELPLDMRGSGLEVYVADTDNDESRTFAYTIPLIPVEPASADNGMIARRHYFIRSSAREGGLPYRSVREEVICVCVEDLFGTRVLRDAYVISDVAMTELEAGE